MKRSVNSGTTFTSLANVTYCAAVGLGKAEASSAYHTIYIWGTVGGVEGVYRSIDQGTTWVRINDNAHEYGGPGNGQFVIGDMNVYGRVYMSTVGRGIAYGETTIAAPVELISFDAFAKQDQIELEWQTASETNNSHFVLEHSLDGLTFTALENIAGAGNSVSLQNYRYTDPTPMQGLNYYRLKQVDLDGEFSYSEIKTVFLQVSETVFLFPNPAKEELHVRSEGMLKELKITDLLGKTMYEQKNLETVQATLDLRTFPKGLYYLNVISETHDYVLKFLKE